MAAQKIPQQPNADALRTQIRGVGLRVTAPRVAVLQRLHRATAPVSHAELCEELAPDGWDRATVYRNLSDLTEAGLVRRTDVGDHVWRFELQSADKHSNAEHPHFVCEQCGEITCLPTDSIEIRGAGTLPKALAKRSVAVQLKGTCDRCE